MFSLFKKKKTYEFTDFCIKISDPNLLAKMAQYEWDKRDKPTEKKWASLSNFMFASGGSFTDKFMKRVGGFWKGSDKIIRATNPDIITINAIIWSKLAMLDLYKNDKENDPETRKMVGDGTIYLSTLRTLGYAQSCCGIDLTRRSNIQSNYYWKSKEAGIRISDAFTHILMSELGRETFQEADGDYELPDDRLSLSMDSIPVAMYSALFFSMTPSLHYNLFKQVLAAYVEKGEQVENEEDDDDNY